MGHGIALFHHLLLLNKISCMNAYCEKTIGWRHLWVNIISCTYIHNFLTGFKQICGSKWCRAYWILFFWQLSFLHLKKWCLPKYYLYEKIQILILYFFLFYENIFYHTITKFYIISLSLFTFVLSIYSIFFFIYADVKLLANIDITNDKYFTVLF